LAEIDQLQQIADAKPYLLGSEQKLSAQIFLAPAKTLSDVLAEHDVSHIDLMVLDLEGAELAALRGMNFTRYSVDAIPSKRAMSRRRTQSLPSMDSVGVPIVPLRAGGRPISFSSEMKCNTPPI
jgi:hypothetical protein